MQLIVKYPDFTLGSYFTCEQERNSGHWYVSFVWAAHLAMQFDLSEFRKIRDTVVTAVRICGHYGYQPKGNIAKVGLASVPYADRQAVPINGDFDVRLGAALPSDGDLSVVASYVTATQIVSDGRSANGYQLVTRYSPPRYYTFVPVSSVRLIIEYESATTACTPPVEVTLDREIAEDMAVLSWSGAEGGTGNAIEGYPIQYRDSADGAVWGDWMDLQTATESPATVAPIPERGAYRQFRVCAQGSAGAAYRSEWAVSAPLRTNTLPGKPGPVIPGQSIVEAETVDLSWASAVGGLSAVAGYRVERQIAGGDWELLSALVDALVYQASMQGMDRGQSVLFRVCAVDMLGGVSAWAYSSEVFRNRIPPTPVIVWPATGALCLSKYPVFGITVPADPEGQRMTLQLRKGATGAWVDAGSVPASGCARKGFRLSKDLSASLTGVYARVVDALGAAGEAVSVSVRRVNASWQREITAGTVIADPDISHQADLAELLDVVNARRAWFGADVIAYDTEVGWFANWLPQMRQLWTALAELYALAGETADDITQDGNYPSAATVSLIRTLCEGL